MTLRFFVDYAGRQVMTSRFRIGVLNMKNIFISLLIMSLVACTSASGSAIVTGVKGTPLDPGQVKLYIEAPAKYEVIGIVNASSDAGRTDQESQDYAVQELKNQAAKLGANGVLLVSTGEKITGMMGRIPVMAKTVSGKAISVNNR
jgi:hypothetical protein